VKKKKYLFMIVGLCCFISASITAQASTIKIPGGNIISLSEAPSASEFVDIFQGFKQIGTAVSGICTITSLISFVISLTRLGTSAGNDVVRSRALKGILFSGISLALFGGITVVVGIFWNAI